MKVKDHYVEVFTLDVTEYTTHIIPDLNYVRFMITPMYAGMYYP
jgi:hypothetical protein